MSIFDTAIKRIQGLGADDGPASAAGYPVPMGATYQYQVVNSVNHDDIGLVRMTARRGLHVAPDIAEFRMSTALIYAGDIVGNATSDSISAAATPIEAFFDGTAVGFTGDPRYLYIPMAEWSSARISVFDDLNASTAYSLYGLQQGCNDTATLSAAPVLLDTVTLACDDGSQQAVTFGVLNVGLAGADDTPAAVIGSYYRSVPAIAAGWDYLALKIDPGADPTSGEVQVRVYRSTY